MATQRKISIKRGQHSEKAVIGAGTTISGSDAIEVNIDAEKLSKGEALVLLDEIKQRIHRAKWPLVD